MSAESDQLLILRQSLRAMRDAEDLAVRLSALLKGFHDLGWRQASVSLPNEPLTVVEPLSEGMDADEALNLHTATERMWRTRLQDPDADLLRQQIGEGFFIPENSAATAASTSWCPGDLLLLPFYAEHHYIGIVRLAQPADGQRPTEDSMQIIDLLMIQATTLIQNSQLASDLTIITDELHNQIEELVMLQRVDEELSATLNFDNVMMLAMDWALRRTGATAGMINIITPDGAGLVPVAALGYAVNIAQWDNTNPIPLTLGIAGRAARTREIQIVNDVKADPDYIDLLESTCIEIAVPMEMRGRIIGVLNIESDEPGAFNTVDLAFVRRLAQRAAVALDNARLYREAERRADEMAALYSASRAITSSLERSEVVYNAAQALAAVLNVSGIIIADYLSKDRQLKVMVAYRLGTARNAADVLPASGTEFALSALPEFTELMQQRQITSFKASDTRLSKGMSDFLNRQHFLSLLVIPLGVQDETLGAALLVEGRRERQFTRDEFLLAESLGNQVASAMRQAQLYEDVRELEKLKSEMIRMASHDLRNPLNSAIGYLELLLYGAEDLLTPERKEYVENIRRATNAMKSLIDDLLTLERVESQTPSAWVEVNISYLTHDVVEALQATAALQAHHLTLQVESLEYFVTGNKTYLRQAMTNLVGNSIKYTPDGGTINVHLFRQDTSIVFEVHDNGYGISQERQERLFQRFYRAHEPGTDHVTGTGLGLSLVKAVIDRHQGKLWFESEPGKGSTFSFSLPACEPKEQPSEG